ncbi:WYL domain-containing protein [Gloeobacter kilaueensis]|uniref:Transcriptional regulator n=1 Tax=Gloeobacter kilaueensis (strain ATCC BAA-2537 / CCAP 1431/1 / ULC 316 / JS1) TaxID=1183438 RepID=U5QKR2_GLOK1|nr:WYL domain-containing protein [Gloeobacter kilaueensis]AGY58204.1 transcriptional regulator [Gloeobacter kilaueensis JS1]
MKRKQQTITLSLGNTDKARLENLAVELGVLWGERPNITQLVKNIAQRQLLVAHNADWSEERIGALVKAADLLLDVGEADAAQALGHLLLERGEVTGPLRDRLAERFQGVQASWRGIIDRYIRQTQPFRLLYQDAAERAWQLTVRYARIRFREKRLYLEIWSEECEGNREIPGLTHNWSLRLDRLQGVEVLPAPGKWRVGPDKIEVEMHLYEGLAHAYVPRPEDAVYRWLEREPVRQVVRRVDSTFWFLREIYPYGPDCLIVGPESVRARAIERFQQTCRRYTTS